MTLTLALISDPSGARLGSCLGQNFDGKYICQMNQQIALFSVAFAVLLISGCTGVGQKTFEGDAYQQHFFGDVLNRQADFPYAQMCAEGMRAAKPDPDNALVCSKTSQQAALPYTGRTVNAGWALDMPILYRAKEACLREARLQDAGVKIACPQARLPLLPASTCS